MPTQDVDIDTLLERLRALDQTQFALSPFERDLIVDTQRTL